MVDRRVYLQEVVIGTCTDVAAARRNNAGRHRTSETKWIADGDDAVADARRGLGESDVWECTAVNLEQCEIGLGIRTDHFGVEDTPVVKRDRHLDGVIDHVIVGYDITVRTDKESGSLGLSLTLGLDAARHSGPPLLVAKLFEEALHRAPLRQIRHGGRGFVFAGIGGRLNVDPHYDHGRLDFLHEIGDRHLAGDAIADDGRGTSDGRRDAENSGAPGKPGSKNGNGTDGGQQAAAAGETGCRSRGVGGGAVLCIEGHGSSPFLGAIGVS